MQNKLWIYALVPAFALSLSSSVFASEAQKSETDRVKCERDVAMPTAFTVDRVVDGDTVNVRAKNGVYSVRMLGIDTPETHFMGKSQGRWGNAAAEYLTDLLPVGAKVRLEYDGTACDGHGRVLAHVFKGKVHANAEMVKAGLAANYCVAPSFEYCAEFGKYVSNAIKTGEGMFGDKNYELPYDFRRRIGGNEQRSYVGSMRTKEVLTPGHQDDIPVGERVFFYKKSDVKSPYRIVGDDER